MPSLITSSAPSWPRPPRPAPCPWTASASRAPSTPPENTAGSSFAYPGLTATCASASMPTCWPPLPQTPCPTGPTAMSLDPKNIAAKPSPTWSAHEAGVLRAAGGAGQVDDPPAGLQIEQGVQQRQVPGLGGAHGLGGQVQPEPRARGPGVSGNPQ